MKKYKIKFNDAAPTPDIKVGNVTLKLKRNAEYNEWIVKVYHNGKYSEDESYYTDDKQDAVITMNRMAEDYKKMSNRVDDAIDLPINDKKNTGNVYREIVSAFGAKIAHDAIVKRVSIEEVRAQARGARDENHLRWVLLDELDRVNYTIMGNRVVYSRFDRSTSSLSVKGVVERTDNAYALRLDMAQPAEQAKQKKQNERYAAGKLPEVKRALQKQESGALANRSYERLVKVWKGAVERRNGNTKPIPASEIKEGDEVKINNAFAVVTKVIRIPDDTDIVLQLDGVGKKIYAPDEIVGVVAPLDTPDFKALAQEAKAIEAKSDGRWTDMEAFLTSKGIPARMASAIRYEFRDYVERLINKTPTGSSESEIQRVHERVNERLESKNYQKPSYWDGLTYIDKNGYEVDLSKYIIRIGSKVKGVPEAVQPRLTEITEMYNRTVDAIYLKIEEAARAKDWSRVSKHTEAIKTLEMATIRNGLKRLAESKTYQDLESYNYMSESAALQKLTEYESLLTKVGA